MPLINVLTSYANVIDPTLLPQRDGFVVGPVVSLTQRTEARREKPNITGLLAQASQSPGAISFVQRERRAIIYAIDRISMHHMLTDGS